MGDWLRPAAAVAAFSWLALSVLPPFTPSSRAVDTIAMTDQQVAELADIIDPIEDDGLLGLFDDGEDAENDWFEVTGDDYESPFTSGDLASFLELALDLGSEESLRMLDGEIAEVDAQG